MSVSKGRAATAAFMAIALSAGALRSPEPGNLSEELYYASLRASGSKFCDREWSIRLRQRFDDRFGKRILKLIQTHQQRFGQDPDFVVTTDCLRPGRAYSQKRALEQFEPKLRELERRYGGY